MVNHGCCWQQWQFVAEFVSTGGNLQVGIIASVIAINVNHKKDMTTGVVNTGGKFAAGFNDTGGQLATGALDTDGAP